MMHNMLRADETFFTTIGCMDGRVQEPVSRFGQQKFQTQYPDTITEAGLVRVLANNPQNDFLAGLKKKIEISLNKHHSRGIVVHGHEDCAGNPVDDEKHRGDVRQAINIISSIVPAETPIVGAFVKREDDHWVVEEVNK